jgi:hypothetical protein
MRSGIATLDEKRALMFGYPEPGVTPGEDRGGDTVRIVS